MTRHAGRRTAAAGVGVLGREALSGRSSARPSSCPARAARVLPAPPAARRPARRAQPPPRHRLHADTVSPPRSGTPSPCATSTAGQAAAASPPAPAGPPRPPQGQRRPHQRQRLHTPVLFPSPGGHPPVGLDPGAQLRRHRRWSTPTGPRCCTATARPHEPGNTTGPLLRGSAGVAPVADDRDVIFAEGFLFLGVPDRRAGRVAGRPGSRQRPPGKRVRQSYRASRGIWPGKIGRSRLWPRWASRMRLRRCAWSASR